MPKNATPNDGLFPRMSRDRNWVARRAMDNAWLAQTHEAVVDPGRVIIDPHHHFWNRGGTVYELEALWADTGSGHDVRQSVVIECATRYRRDGPPELRPVGETEYFAALARQARTHPDRTQIGAIIAYAELASPDLDRLLDAHQQAADGLLRGIRQAGAHDPAPEALAIPGRGRAGLYAQPEFRRGVARLGARGLVYETWHYHHQAGDFLALARAVPQTTMVLNHLGTPLGVGRFSGQRARIFARWQSDMEALSACPNVVVKLGGLAMPDNGWGWHDRERPPDSDTFVTAQGLWYRHMLDLFGANRAMFESNFPVDRVSISYRVLWNAFKKMAAHLPESGKTAVFAGTARRVYGL